MVNQTQMNGNRMGTVRHNLAGLAHDAITLTELQCQLVAVDLREMRQVGVSAGMQMVAGAILALGCLPVLLIAGSHCLIEFAHWSAAASYATVGGAAFVIALFLLWGGMRKLTRSMKTLQRSREEFAETLRWLKNSLRAEERATSAGASEFPWRRT